MTYYIKVFGQYKYGQYKFVLSSSSSFIMIIIIIKRTQIITLNERIGKKKNDSKFSFSRSSIGHYRVFLCLCFKKSLSANSLIFKQTKVIFIRMICSKTRFETTSLPEPFPSPRQGKSPGNEVGFETEAQENQKMPYCILQELTNLYAISSIPHFKFFKNKKVNNFFQSK